MPNLNFRSSSCECGSGARGTRGGGFCSGWPFGRSALLMHLLPSPPSLFLLGLVFN